MFRAENIQFFFNISGAEGLTWAVPSRNLNVRGQKEISFITDEF